MNAELHVTMKWALRLAAVAGLLLSLSTLPIAWAVVTGHAKMAFSYAAFLPYQLTWYSLAGTGAATLLTGALCVLLLVSGGRPARVLAVVAVVWTVYHEVAFSQGGYWHVWFAVRADPTPLFVGIAITGVVLIAVCVAALVVASRLSAPKPGRLSGPANKPPQTDAAPRRG